MGPIHGEELHKGLGDVTGNVVAKETIIAGVIRNGKKQLIVAAKIVGVMVVAKAPLDLVARKAARVRLGRKDHKALWGKEVHRDLTYPPVRPAPPVLLVLLAQLAPPVLLVRQVLLLRQYMHNTEIAVTMRLSTILKTIKQPL